MIRYRERLWPSPSMFISSALVIPASLLVFLPINPTAGVVVAIVLYLGCASLLIAGSPVVMVTDTEICAGPARLPIEMAGAAVGYTSEEAQAERGPRLDARTWLLIRGWISPVVKIENLDEGDPVPYWVVSTRNPARLTAAIDEARRQHFSNSAP